MSPTTLTREDLIRQGFEWTIDGAPDNTAMIGRDLPDYQLTVADWLYRLWGVTQNDAGGSSLRATLMRGHHAPDVTGWLHRMWGLTS